MNDTLEDMVGLDEGSSREVPDDGKRKPLKKGYSTQWKTKALVMAEAVKGNPTKKSHKHTAVKHIKMIVIDTTLRRCEGLFLHQRCG